MTTGGPQAGRRPADADEVEGLLAAARDLLGMELAYLAELQDDALILHEVEGDIAAFGGVAAGARIPRPLSWCHAMAAGEAPRLVGDTAADPGAREHPFASSTGIRAYVGAPVRRADGSVFGTLCCLSRTPRPDLDERDLRGLDALARMAAKRLSRAADAQARRRAEVESAAGQALIAALNARENYTAAHSEAVLALALDVARELGLGEADAAAAGHVALLHDIGKVGVPDAILQKAGRLTAPEWEIMREHSAIGARIVSAIGPLAHLAPAVRAEHERWDGRGYPDGLAGEAIPLASRICLLCDAWHAMTSDRPYRRALSPPEARAEIERHAGTQFCPHAAAALLRILDRRADGAATEPVPEPAPERLPQVRPDRPLEAELRALIEVAKAVAGAQREGEVLEVIAAQVRAVLRAAGVTVNRWEPGDQQFRTLVSVGEREDRHPADERHGLTGLGGRLVRERRAFAVSLDDDDVPPDERAVLEQLGEGSMVSAPIVVEGRLWGRLDAFAGHGMPPFTPDHLRFVEALCSQVSVAIARAEVFSRLEHLAYRDPLTGLPNRRALDERLEDEVAAALAGDTPLTLVFCDLDGLKLINDHDGHDAGDAALAEAGRSLADAAEAYPGSLTTRLGGDEFCVLMPGHGPDAARALARDATHRLAATSERPLTFSCGVACLDAEHRRASDLFRAADAAQYAAKRVGGGKVFVAEQEVPAPAVAPHGGWSRRRFRDAGPHEREALAAFVLDKLDGELAGCDALARLETVACAFADAYDAARWAISRALPRARAVETLLGAERRDRYDPDAPDVRFSVEGESYLLADYPTTARVLAAGGGFAIEVDDEDADASERALLADWGFTAVTAAAARASDGSAWLVELFSDRRTHALPAALTSLRLLAGEAVARADGRYAATSRAKVSKTST